MPSTYTFQTPAFAFTEEEVHFISDGYIIEKWALVDLKSITLQQSHIKPGTWWRSIFGGLLFTAGLLGIGIELVNQSPGSVFEYTGIIFLVSSMAYLIPAFRKDWVIIFQSKKRKKRVRYVKAFPDNTLDPLIEFAEFKESFPSKHYTLFREIDSSIHRTST